MIHISDFTTGFDDDYKLVENTTKMEKTKQFLSKLCLLLLLPLVVMFAMLTDIVGIRFSRE